MKSLSWFCRFSNTTLIDSKYQYFFQLHIQRSLLIFRRGRAKFKIIFLIIQKTESFRQHSHTQTTKITTKQKLLRFCHHILNLFTLCYHQSFFFCFYRFYLWRKFFLLLFCLLVFFFYFHQQTFSLSLFSVAV